ncbi:hypothetical protein BD410DRAFT_842731 [Rickenella mellea]|uniref:Uncharacterized protein n=1 Tax=Rickenella mellea TaxID=50990 RepID=A0A4Y7PU34_9AGAM|nr:hypothetical protein BD410DRAFT_842731 [Rickenella mellea]
MEFGGKRFNDTLRDAISAATSNIHNPNNLESHWYEVCNLVLTTLFHEGPGGRHTVCPQRFLQYREMVGGTAETRWKIPDFIVLDTIVEGSGRKRIIRLQLPRSTAEIKRWVTKVNSEEPDWNAIEALAEQALVHARRQARVALTTSPLDEVVALACVGFHWTFRIFRRAGTQSHPDLVDITFKEDPDAFERPGEQVQGWLQLQSKKSDKALLRLRAKLRQKPKVLLPAAPIPWPLPKPRLQWTQSTKSGKRSLYTFAPSLQTRIARSPSALPFPLPPPLGRSLLRAPSPFLTALRARTTVPAVIPSAQRVFAFLRRWL